MKLPLRVDGLMILDAEGRHVVDAMGSDFPPDDVERDLEQIVRSVNAVGVLRGALLGAMEVQGG